MSRERAGLRAELRRSWGQEVERERDLEVIARLHRFKPSGRRTVEEQTWQDLGMDAVFCRIDRAVSIPGQQVLYDQLRTYESEETVLEERARQHALFRCDVGLRERLQLALSRLNRSNAQYLAPLILGPFPIAPRFAGWLCLSAALPALCLVGAWFLPPLYIGALLALIVNAVIHATYGQTIIPYFSGFAEINTLLGVARELTSDGVDERVPQLAFLHRARSTVAHLRKRIGWLVTDRTALPELSQAIFGYLNMFFLVDVLTFLRSNHALRENQAALAEILEAVGSLDASISVASYLEGLPLSCVPQRVNSRELKAQKLYHPLVSAAVGNSIGLSNCSAIIAGPNMAGKTSFIRTIGINVILAQTLNLAHAEQALLPRAEVHSSIRREDKLSEGESYFFAEIKQVGRFLRPLEEGRLQLLLIDEIFRGTNTIERIASSVAVLRHLAAERMVFATTHDMELQELLADSFAMFHFSDRVVDGKYGFDYLLRTGPVRTRNAITLLELSGYPPSVIEQAQALAAQLNRASGQQFDPTQPSNSSSIN